MEWVYNIPELIVVFILIIIIRSCMFDGGPEEAGHASFIVINNRMNTLKLEPFSSSESAFYPTLLFLLVYLSCNMSPASL